LYIVLVIFINSNNLTILKDILAKDLVIIPIAQDVSKHHTDTDISVLYLYDISTKSEFILNQCHNDAQRFNLNSLKSAKNLGNHFVYGQEYLDKYLSQSLDLELYYWFAINDQLEINYPSVYNFYERNFLGISNVGNSIPLAIHIDYAREIKNKFIGIYGSVDIIVFKRYCTDVFKEFKRLERNYIPTDKSLLDLEYKGLSLKSNYRLYTSTGRPSNAFSGINLAALNKVDESRKIIKADDGFRLVEFDFDAYHLRLIANLIDYQLPKGNLHDYFGRQYFKTPFLNNEDYEKSKIISFQMLYGQIKEEYEHIDFFAKVNSYRKKIYEKYLADSFIETPIYKRRMLKGNLGKMSATKLFNYILQAYETEYNSLMLRQIQDYIYEYVSNLILFTYDSFLIHLKKEEATNVLNGIKKIMNQGNMSTSTKHGKNYHEMKSMGN